MNLLQGQEFEFNAPPRRRLHKRQRESESESDDEDDDHVEPLPARRSERIAQYTHPQPPSLLSCPCAARAPQSLAFGISGVPRGHSLWWFLPCPLFNDLIHPLSSAHRLHSQGQRVNYNEDILAVAGGPACWQEYSSEEGQYFPTYPSLPSSGDEYKGWEVSIRLSASYASWLRVCVLGGCWFACARSPPGTFALARLLRPASSKFQTISTFKRPSCVLTLLFPPSAGSECEWCV